MLCTSLKAIAVMVKNKSGPDGMFPGAGGGTSSCDIIDNSRGTLSYLLLVTIDHQNTVGIILTFNGTINAISLCFKCSHPRL